MTIERSPKPKRRRGAPIEVGFDGLTLHVRDLDRSRDFYRRVPGFQEVGHRPGRISLFQVGDRLLGLLQLPRSSGFHLEVGVSDLDEMHRRLLEAGLEPQSGPLDRPWGERTFNLVDPDGFVMEMQEA